MIVNVMTPAYRDALYEQAFKMPDGSIQKLPPGFAVRGNEIRNGELVSIDPFICKEVPEGDAEKPSKSLKE